MFDTLLLRVTGFCGRTVRKFKGSEKANGTDCTVFRKLSKDGNGSYVFDDLREVDSKSQT